MPGGRVASEHPVARTEGRLAEGPSPISRRMHNFKENPMSFRGSVTRLAVGAASLLFVAATATAENVTWDLSTVFPPGNFHVKNLRTFAEAANEATGGELTITVHDSGSLGVKGTRGDGRGSRSHRRRRGVLARVAGGRIPHGRSRRHAGSRPRLRRDFRARRRHAALPGRSLRQEQHQAALHGAVAGPGPLREGSHRNEGRHPGPEDARGERDGPSLLPGNGGKPDPASLVRGRPGPCVRNDRRGFDVQHVRGRRQVLGNSWKTTAATTGATPSAS